MLDNFLLGCDEILASVSSIFTVLDKNQFSTFICTASKL